MRLRELILRLFFWIVRGDSCILDLVIGRKNGSVLKRFAPF